MSDTPDREEVKDMIAVATVPIVSELKWLRWLVFALLAATVSPKVGGPDATQAVASLLGSAAQAAGFPH
jgi:hypothetical protein